MPIDAQAEYDRLLSRITSLRAEIEILEDAELIPPVREVESCLVKLKRFFSPEPAYPTSPVPSQKRLSRARAARAHAEHWVRVKVWLEEHQAWVWENHPYAEVVQEVELDYVRLLIRKKLLWRFLPPSDPTGEAVLAFVRSYQRRNPQSLVELGRFTFARSLKPSYAAVGIDAFDGYIAFVFERGPRALLEHVEWGNAAYVFGHNWEALSKLSKAELLESHSCEHIRIKHVGSVSDWGPRIRKALKRI